MELLQNQVKQTAQLDSVLLKHAARNNNIKLAVSLRELKFRTLVETQARLYEAFENEGENKKQEVHGNWVFKEQVSMMLPYMQTTERYSRTKTKLLWETINLLPQIQDINEKKRCWLAINRMLTKIDIKKSESGYRPFQRSSEGIFTDQHKVITALVAANIQETDPETKLFSNQIVNKIKQKYQSRQDEAFWRKVESARQHLRTFEANRKSTNDFSDEISAATIDGLTAYQWFQKGFSTDANKLKIDYYSKAIKLNSEYAPAFNNRGNAYESLGKYELAIQDYDSAAHYEPHYAPVYINRGNVYQRLNQFDRAINDYSQAIELEPKYTLAYNHRGISYENLHQFDKAIDDFSKAIELDPGYATAYSNRGDVYRFMREDSLAILDYSQAITLDSFYALAYNNRALCYKILGQLDKAINDHKKAIEIDPQNAAAYYNLGRVYWERRKWEDVILAWEKCLEIDPNHKNALKWLPTARNEAKLVKYRKLRSQKK